MKRDIVLLALMFILLLVVQLTVVPFLAVDFVSPDLILILLVSYTLAKGQFFGTITGAVFGLLFDLFSGGLIGSSMFSKTLAGFTAGYFYNENKMGTNLESINFTYIVFLCAFIDSFFYGIFSGSDKISLSFLLLDKGILPALYTSAVSVIILVFKPKRFVT